MQESVSFEVKPIGIIRSPFTCTEDCPRSGILTDESSFISIFPEYKDALLNIEENEYLHIIYWADKAVRDVQIVTPKRVMRQMGVFATRSPARPNPICTSLCKVVSINGTEIEVKRLEAFNGSYLIDIKPYLERADTPN